MNHISVQGLEYLPLEDGQQQQRQSMIAFPQLYSKQQGQHKQDTIEDTSKSPTTAAAKINHHWSLHSGGTGKEKFPWQFVKKHICVSF